MLCQYNGDDKKEHCNEYEEIDKTPQFLRWLEEWARKYCTEKSTRAREINETCEDDIINKIHTYSIDNIPDEPCKTALTKYRNWYNNNYLHWENLKKKYESNKKNEKEQTTNGAHLSPSTTTSFYKDDDAEAYVKRKCKECTCNYKDLQEEYKRITEGNNEVSTLIHRARIDSFDLKKRLFYNILTLGGLGPNITKQAIDAVPNIIYKGSHYGFQAATNVISGLNRTISSFTRDQGQSRDSNSPDQTTQRDDGDEPPLPDGPPGKVPATDQITNALLGSAIPLGVGIAFASLAYLLLKVINTYIYIPSYSGG